MFRQKSDVCSNFRTNNKIDQKKFLDKNAYKFEQLHREANLVEISNGDLFCSHIADKFDDIFVQNFFWSILLLV